MATTPVCLRLLAIPKGEVDATAILRRICLERVLPTLLHRAPHDEQRSRLKDERGACTAPTGDMDQMCEGERVNL